MRVELLAQAQHESLIDLLRELHTYYNPDSEVSRSAVREHLLGNLLAPGAPLRLVVAVNDDGTVAGLAAIAPTYSLVDPMPQQCRQIQLKELYVCASQRSRGVGKALMAWVARYAADSGCHRIDWPVNAANARGIAFYEGLGATRVADRLSYRLAGRHLSELAGAG